jgi:plastocyanin domain-containing protein
MPQRPDGRGRIRIAITEDGFSPQRTHVTVHEPVTLTVTRLVADTCAKELVLEQFGILVPLPLGEPVTVQFTPTEAGPIRFTCTLNGIAGEIVAD